jgi:hypothetical protein
LGAKYLVVLRAGSTLPLAKQSLDEAPYKLSGAVAKLASITFLSLAFSYWIDNLGFITEGKLAAIFIKPSLGVSNWPVIYFINYTPTSFLAPFITAPSNAIKMRDYTDESPIQLLSGWRQRRPRVSCPSLEASPRCVGIYLALSW